LVLGTAFPHLLRFTGSSFHWSSVIIGTSILASIGGIILFLTVKDGPFHEQKITSTIDVREVWNLFKIPNFRSAAFGYFGHMWELYTFWAFVPVMLTFYLATNEVESMNVSFWSFSIIGIGGIGCAVGGHLSLGNRSKQLAMVSLLISGLCCLIVPFSFSVPLSLFILLLLIWGVFVIPDSPQFSTLVAKSCPTSNVATGLTIVNSLGFALTIVSIQIVNSLWDATSNPLVFLVMFIGPVLGFFNIYKYNSQ
jgi:predicted MFS family arabinose efflux permease